MNLRRLLALIAKERKQLFRDPFNLIVGIGLPIALLVIMGYGLSFDIKDIRLAVVEPERTTLSSDIVARFRASPYFSAQVVRSTEEGVELVRKHEADSCLLLPPDLERRLASGHLDLFIATNASNPLQAQLKENYIKSVLLPTLPAGTGGATPVPRMWFNEAGESIYFMIPGLLVIILTLIGVLLTSMLMAKEYEQGNVESMFVTPMRSLELLLAKAINNFVIGITGTLITLAAAHWLFHMPLAGSLWIVLVGCSLYLLMSLSAGLLISSLTKNQFVASEVTMVVTFLPSMMLSGYVFEIENLPVVIQWISRLVPARYFVDFLQTVFLVGNYWHNILYNLGMIFLFTVVMIALAIRKNPKHLEG